jgi:hypothetical protein
MPRGLLPRVGFVLPAPLFPHLAGIDVFACSWWGRGGRSKVKEAELHFCDADVGSGGKFVAEGADEAGEGGMEG